MVVVVVAVFCYRPDPGVAPATQASVPSPAPQQEDKDDTPQDTVKLSLTRQLSESLSGANRFYIYNFANLDVRHRLPYKFTVGCHGGFGVDRYPDTLTVSNGTTGMPPTISGGAE